MIPEKIKTIINNVFKWLVDKWLAGFITATIYFTLKLYIDLPKETKEDFFSFIWFKDILMTPIKFYYVILLVLLFFVINNVQKKLNEKTTPKKITFDFKKYNSDIFGSKKTTWTWNYKWNPNGSFSIINLKPLCPSCKTGLNINSYKSADCFKCRLEGKLDTHIVYESISDVEAEISRRINSGEFKKG